MLQTDLLLSELGVLIVLPITKTERGVTLPVCVFSESQVKVLQKVQYKRISYADPDIQFLNFV